jgi:lipopolysaccharide biosynthesis glycosyltransferase
VQLSHVARDGMSHSPAPSVCCESECCLLSMLTATPRHVCIHVIVVSASNAEVEALKKQLAEAEKTIAKRDYQILHLKKSLEAARQSA